VEELKNALSVINSHIGMKVYEICESSVYNKGCSIDDYTCEHCGSPLWETKLDYENLEYIGKSIFFTKKEAEKRLEELKARLLK